MDGYVALGIMFVLAFAFPVFPLIVAPILQPRQPTAEKQIPYECGVDTIGKTKVCFSSHHRFANSRKCLRLFIIYSTIYSCNIVVYSFSI